MLVTRIVRLAGLILLGTCATVANASEDKIQISAQELRTICKPDAIKNDLDIQKFCRQHLNESIVSSVPPAGRSAMAATSAPMQKPPKAKLPTDDPCDKRLFVRADPLDNAFYAVLPTSAGNAKGASLSYTNKASAGTQSADINGIVSFVAFGSGPCGYGGGGTTTLWAIAPWVSSSGTWNEPVSKTENEALKGGVDLQVGLLAPTFFNSQHYFDLSPFDQTDFRGKAHAGGINLAYEPVIPFLYLGQSPGAIIPHLLNGYWELRAESEFRNVTSAGVTNLTVGNYEWFGGTIRGQLFLFYDPVPGSWEANSAIANRISLIGTYQDYGDARSSLEARKYSAEIQYKLSGCSMGQESDPKCQTSDQSSSSISFEYDWGTDKDTLVFTKQYLAKLSYKY